jgi:putative tryptophan/tyrosine transport system substrate-binding protein
MRRREVVALFGGTAASMLLRPLCADAQQTDRMRRIGVIMGFSAEDEVWQAYLATFKGRLQELGWTEGRNLRIDYRFTGASTERTRAAAEEIVARAPDVIFVSTNPVVSAVLQATHTLPIVFTWVSDSVGSGYMTNLAHPGGNITGFHNFEPAIGGKWLQLLNEVAPSVASRSSTFRKSWPTSHSSAQPRLLQSRWE